MSNAADDFLIESQDEIRRSFMTDNANRFDNNGNMIGGFNTDTLVQPNPLQITVSEPTVIQPYGYLVFWIALVAIGAEVVFSHK